MKQTEKLSKLLWNEANRRELWRVVKSPQEVAYYLVANNQNKEIITRTLLEKPLPRGNNLKIRENNNRRKTTMLERGEGEAEVIMLVGEAEIDWNFC